MRETVMNRTLKITFITVVAFGTHFLFDSLYFRDIRAAINEVINHVGLSHNIAYSIVGIPIFIGTLLISKKSHFFENLGLNRNIWQAFAFAAVCTLPSFVGFSLFFDLNTEINLNRILVTVVAAAFFEELYFRGFLYGQLFRHTAIGFIASVLLGALLFGLIHLYQSNDAGELVGIFLITFLGAVLFAWAYTEWNYNLWVPIMLHLLMNLAWELFNVSDNALGGVYSNVFRTVTIALIIGLTILYKKRKGLPLEVNKKTFFIKKPLAAPDHAPGTQHTVAKVAG